MSDDRDKYHELREYLRNNKPKRNLGNGNSDNAKFNSKKDLNFRFDNGLNSRNDVNNNTNLNNNLNSKSKVNSINLEKELNLDNHANNDANLKEKLNSQKQDCKDTSNLDSLNSNNSSNSKTKTSTQIPNNKNSNKRDYDKEPIIIKNYEKIFITHQWTFSFIFSFTVLLFAKSIINKYIDDILFFLVLLFLEILVLIFLIYKHNKNLQSTIKLKNEYIGFYENDKSVKITTFENLSFIISKPFWRHYDNYPMSDKIFFAFMVSILLYILGKIGVIFFMIFLLSNIFFKICVYFMINKSLKGFKIFPIIVIDKPTYQEGFISSEGYITSGKYYFLYIYEKDKYSDIKQYFLYQTGINIDKIKKDYFN